MRQGSFGDTSGSLLCPHYWAAGGVPSAVKPGHTSWLLDLELQLLLYLRKEALFLLFSETDFCHCVCPVAPQAHVWGWALCCKPRLLDQMSLE